MGGLHQLDDLPLLSWRPKGPFITAPDVKRLGRQLQLVHAFMLDGKPHGLQEIADATGQPAASVSARLRDLRNQLGCTIERKNLGNGLWTYRMVV